MVPNHCRGGGSRGGRSRGGGSHSKATVRNPKNDNSHQHTAIAKKGEVPDHLVGKAYRDFTTAEHWETKKFRRGMNVCEGCGYWKYAWWKIKSHHFTECPRLQKRNRYRTEHNLCRECGSPEHDWEDCPVQRRLERELAPLASFGQVPNKYVGWSYSAMDEHDRAEVKEFRVQRGICTEYGSPGHRHYTCEIRLQRVRDRFNEKIAAIAAGRVTLNVSFSGPLANLPLEITKKILMYATQPFDHEDVVFEPGFLTPVKHMLRAGLPMEELVEGFVCGNVFHFPAQPMRWYGTAPAHWFDRFVGFLESHNACKSLRAVSLVDPIQDFARLTDVCSGLKKLKIQINARTVGKWHEDPYVHGDNQYSEPEEKVPADIQHKLDVPIFASIQQLKAITFHAHRCENWQRWGSGSLEQGGKLLVTLVKAAFEVHGRPDIYVGFSDPRTKPYRDVEWENV